MTLGTYDISTSHCTYKVHVADKFREHQASVIFVATQFFGIIFTRTPRRGPNRRIGILDSNGQLVTSNGYAIQPGITIPAQAQSVTIAADGTVTATLPGQATPASLGQIQLASFANVGGLDPKGENLFMETASSGTPASGAPGSNGLGKLQQGFVETSNVNVVEELVSMITTQRAYELNSKAIQTSDQMLQRLGQL